MSIDPIPVDEPEVEPVPVVADEPIDDAQAGANAALHEQENDNYTRAHGEPRPIQEVQE